MKTNKEMKKCCENYNGTLDVTNSCIFCKEYQTTTALDDILSSLDKQLTNKE